MKDDEEEELLASPLMFCSQDDAVLIFGIASINAIKQEAGRQKCGEFCSLTRLGKIVQLFLVDCTITIPVPLSFLSTYSPPEEVSLMRCLQLPLVSIFLGTSMCTTLVDERRQEETLTASSPTYAYVQRHHDISKTTTVDLNTS